MTIRKIKEMAKAIYKMHGLADRREQQRFLFDGKIFFYNMKHIVNNGDFYKEGYYLIKVRVSRNTIYTITLYNDRVGNIYGKRYDRYKQIKINNKFTMPIKCVQ